MTVKSSKFSQAPESKDEIKNPHFLGWAEHFFAYLVREKSGTNPALLELIYCLGDDGRQELALSVFNFLRPEQWKLFCRERRVAKDKTKKLLSRAISDLRRAAKLHGKMITSIPEIGFCRQIGNDRPIHLSDLLEQEATFLAAQVRIMRCASSKLSSIDHQRPFHSALGGHSKTQQLLSKVSAKLSRAAQSYRELLTLTSTIRIAAAFTGFRPNEVKMRLEVEAKKLAENSSRVNSAFNKKRLGINADWAFLVRLQDFVEEFGLRRNEYLPTIAARKLGESDLADLLEAGGSAQNPDNGPSEIDAGSIGRAIERFRLRKSNLQTCLSLKTSAQTICDRLTL